MGMFDGAAVEQRRKALRYQVTTVLLSPASLCRASQLGLLTIKVLTRRGGSALQVLLEPPETQPHASD